MRINYYRFPEDMTDEQRFNAYFEMLTWNPANDLDDIEQRKQRALSLDEKAPYELDSIKVSTAKKMLKAYGGIAFTCHFDRDGGLFESTEIKLKGNNSRFTYNRHL